MKRVYVVVAGLGFGLAGPLTAQDFEFKKELASGSTFALRNIIGDVRIDGTSGKTVEVTATKKAGRHGDPDDVEVKAVEIDGGVSICVYYPGQGGRDYDRDDDDDDNDRSSRRSKNRRDHDSDDFCNRGNRWGNNNNRNDTEVNFIVKVPAGLKLDIKTVSGDVIGQGLKGAGMDLGTVSGNLSLTDVTATSLDANSVSGDVDLDRIAAKEVSAETISGNVTFAGDIDGQGAYDFKTLSGDVILTLPREPNAKVSAVTFSGGLSSDFPVNRDSARKRRNRFNATWGSGGAQLDLESFSGDIEIRSAK